jgi:hypothetical protein
MNYIPKGRRFIGLPKLTVDRSTYSIIQNGPKGTNPATAAAVDVDDNDG